MKVIVGLSGGVDSSVTAQLLVDAGHEVSAVYMRNWNSEDEQCPTAQDSIDAMKVAEKIGIPFKIIDFSQQYWDDVFAYFLEENKVGRTPNPDILCNKYIKFKAFLDYVLAQGADALATGHYARQQINPDTGLAELALPVDASKDQTYFLHQLSQEPLSKAMFPLADYTKKEVRKLAEKYGFVTAHKKDSTGICFIGERHYATFLQKYLKKEPGDIRDFETQKKVAEHKGLSFYTIGQSKGVGIGGQRDFPEGKWYVHSKDLEQNILYVTQNEDLLLGSELTAHKINWIAGNTPSKNFKAQAKIRYRDEGSTCMVTVLDDDLIKVAFDQPVRAITSGQSVVLYLDDVCLGGGEIV